jgi:[ribosomal protein S18]-alanine N-acetyltransferase
MSSTLTQKISSFELRGERLFISSMNIGDVDKVCTIEETIYDFPWTSGNFKDSLQAGYSGTVVRITDDANRVLAEQLIVAYAMTMQLPDEVHLLNISVAKPYQRRGIGRAYLKVLIEDAQRQGTGGVLLEVRPSNAAAIQLYRSEGFEQVGLRKGYYPGLHSQREDALVLLLAPNSQLR